jgi:hypothetical protein
MARECESGARENQRYAFVVAYWLNNLLADLIRD